MNRFSTHPPPTSILICLAFVFTTSCSEDLRDKNTTIPTAQPDHCLCIQNMSNLTDSLLRSVPIWINNCIGLEFPDEYAIKALYVDSIAVEEEEKQKLSHILQLMDSCKGKKDWVVGGIDYFEDQEDYYTTLVYRQYGEDGPVPVENIDAEIVLGDLPASMAISDIRTVSGCTEFLDVMRKFREDYVAAVIGFIDDPYGFDNYRAMVRESRKLGYYLGVLEISDCLESDPDTWEKWGDGLLPYRQKLWDMWVE